MPTTDASNPTIGILLIDDHALVRAALRMILETAGMTIVGEAGNKAEAIPIAALYQPEIILLDLCLAEEDGIDLIPELSAVAEKSKIIVLTGVKDPSEHQRATRAGAVGVLLKETTPEMLVKAIHRVHEGRTFG